MASAVGSSLPSSHWGGMLSYLWAKRGHEPRKHRLLFGGPSSSFGLRQDFLRSEAVTMAGKFDWTEDEIVLVIGLLHQTGGKVPSVGDERLIALSDYLKVLPIYPEHERDSRFRSPSSVRMKCFNLLANDPTLYKAKNLVPTNADIWGRYWGNDQAVSERISLIREAGEFLRSQSGTILVSDDEYDHLEGGLVLRSHRRRERSSSLRKKIVAERRARHGELRCDFCEPAVSVRRATDQRVREAVYEVHHLQPLGSLSAGKVARTRLCDLVLLCANCHRIVHALMAVEGRPVSLEEMHALLGSSLYLQGF